MAQMKGRLNCERRRADLNFVHMRAQKKLNAMDTTEPGRHNNMHVHIRQCLVW